MGTEVTELLVKKMFKLKMGRKARQRFGRLV
jgi:hypothetical protein